MLSIQLDAWRQDLPPELKLTPSNERQAFPHKLMMHAAFWWQRILLHRPFYQRHRAQFVDSGFSVAVRCIFAITLMGKKSSCLLPRDAMLPRRRSGTFSVSGAKSTARFVMLLSRSYKPSSPRAPFTFCSLYRLLTVDDMQSHIRRQLWITLR